MAVDLKTLEFIVDLAAQIEDDDQLDPALLKGAQSNLRSLWITLSNALLDSGTVRAYEVPIFPAKDGKAFVWDDRNGEPTLDVSN